MHHSLRAIIIGGGIGGLAAAIALHHIGVETTVYEREAVPSDGGAGLWLWPNALYALGQLGRAAAVRAAGVEGASGQIRDWRRRTLVPAIADAETVTITRAELCDVLRTALPPSCLHFGAACTTIEQRDDKVVVRFSEGSTAEADVLIGADGIHSVVRAALHGNVPARYAGFMAYRAVVLYQPGQIVPGVSWGRGARFGVMPLRDGRVNWFAALNESSDSRIAPDERQAHLLARFRDWHAPVADLIATTDPQAILRHPVYDRPPLRRWSVGRATLLGDAAHPLTPSLGQGACLALEDAVELAACLSDSSDIAEALRLYEQRRIRRTSGVARQARLLDHVTQMEAAPLCALRDILLRALPSRVRDRGLQSILNYRTPALERAAPARLP